MSLALASFHSLKAPQCGKQYSGNHILIAAGGEPFAPPIEVRAPIVILTYSILLFRSALKTATFN